MDRDMKDLLKLWRRWQRWSARWWPVCCLFSDTRKKSAIFFAELKMKCPCKRCEEDDYADEELNSLCDMDSIIE